MNYQERAEGFVIAGIAYAVTTIVWQFINYPLWELAVGHGAAAIWCFCYHMVSNRGKQG